MPIPPQLIPPLFELGLVLLKKLASNTKAIDNLRISIENINNNISELKMVVLDIERRGIVDDLQARTIAVQQQLSTCRDIVQAKSMLTHCLNEMIVAYNKFKLRILQDASIKELQIYVLGLKSMIIMHKICDFDIRTILVEHDNAIMLLKSKLLNIIAPRLISENNFSWPDAAQFINIGNSGSLSVQIEEILAHKFVGLGHTMNDEGTKCKRCGVSKVNFNRFRCNLQY